MSNPTTHAEQFDGSLGAFTGVAPIAFGGGLVLAEGSVNYCPNPDVATTNDWLSFSSVGGNSDGARVTDQPDMGPAAWRFRVLTYVLNDSYLTGFRATTQVAGHTGKITPSARVKANRAIGLVTLQTRLYYTDTSQENTNITGVTLPTDPTRIVFPAATINPAKTLNQARGHIVPTTATQTGDIIWIAKGQLENKGYATPLFSGADGDGFGWLTTPNNSPSTRAASSAAISPAGILSPDTGSLAFRITPTIETGVEEIWGECGIKGSGTDHLRWGRDSSKHPFVEWSSNDAAYQRLTGSETLNAGSARIWYLGWNGTTVSLGIDNNALQTGTRAVVSGSWGAGPIKLQASKGGNIVSPFATYDQALSANRRSIIVTAITNGTPLGSLFEDWTVTADPVDLFTLSSGQATSGVTAEGSPVDLLTLQTAQATAGVTAEGQSMDLLGWQGGSGLGFEHEHTISFPDTRPLITIGES